MMIVLNEDEIKSAVVEFAMKRLHLTTDEANQPKVEISNHGYACAATIYLGEMTDTGTFVVK